MPALPKLTKLVAASKKKGGGPGAAPPPSATKKQPPAPAAPATGESPGDGMFSFDELTPDDFEKLQQMAEAAQEAGLIPEAGPESSERVPQAGGDDDGAANEEPKAGGPGDDGSEAEGDEEAGGDEAGTVDEHTGADTLWTLVQTCEQEAQSDADAITKLIDTAQEMRAGKPAKVQALAKKAGPLVEQVKDAAKAAEEAYGNGGEEADTKALALAYAECDEACRSIKELLQDAKVAAGKADPADEEGGPEGGEGEEGDEKEKAPGKGKAPAGRGPKGARRSKWEAWATR